MQKNIIRLMILSVLIILCIWQTITLWLGDMSGHNFFASSISSDESSYIHPKQIWNNINGSIYKIISHSEKEDLLNELVTELRKDNIHIELGPKETYEQLLYESQGMVYEFGTPLTIDEIIGEYLEPKNSKYESVNIKQIYVDVSLAHTYKVYVYLIDQEAKVKQKITLKVPLKYAADMIALYKEQENVKYHKLYQPSITSTSDREFFVGNVFYPQMNARQPLKGKLFKFTKIEEADVENYIRDLFKNPSFITNNTTTSSTVYSDNLNISVKYNNTGTLEFKKTLLNDTGKLTDVERINKINAFIEDSRAIPNSLKKGLYLEEVYLDEETGEMRYRFGYRHEDSEIVILSETVKRSLNIESFLELGIKNSEVISGKWLMYQIEHTNEDAQITMESKDAIEAVYENSGLLELEAFKLDDLECAYILNNTSRPVAFEWLGVYMGQPIFTVEKIDNE
ncbi:MAG: hypothetical protein IIY08_08845 [Cellulosilyticum sp.]|nr:hypothetical protein [Cellulosilyticum sp.]